MKSIFTMIVSVVVFIANCAHVHEYSSFTEINSFMVDKKVQVNMREGRIFEAYDLHIMADSTSWLHPINHNKQYVSTSKVKSIVHKNPGRGALEGMGLGIAIGIGVGTIVGFASGDDPEGIALVSGLFWGGTFGLLGLPMGAATGSEDIFLIDVNKNTSSK